MNLNLIAYPGQAQTIANAHIEQRVQVPHVPLKFNSETDNAIIVAVISDPTSLIHTISDDEDLTAFVSMYNSVTEKAISADYIYKEEDVINNTDRFILDLFDKLQLDEENYKNKTGSKSLRDDVITKEVHFERTNYQVSNTPVDLSHYKLEESIRLYSLALEKSISL